MSNSLRSKLAAMNHDIHREVPTIQTKPDERRFLFTIPEVLIAPNEKALKRMGLDMDWPGLDQILFLDTETTGLSGGAGTVVFMIGLAYIENSSLVFEQYTLGSYADEPLILTKVGSIMAQRPLVITFNGRSFDIPLLRSRFTMARLDALWHEPCQLDLLLSARKIWKRRLGTVKLSVLEEKILRSGRQDDLSGSEAPQRFFDYLKSGDDSLLEPVKQHNMQDVLNLPSVMSELLTAYSDINPDREPEDLLSLGRTLEKQGERQEAVRCYHIASLPRTAISIVGLRQKRITGEALFALGILNKQMGQYDRAIKAFEQAANRNQMGIAPLIELAKHYEHRSHQLDQALYWTDKALQIAENLADIAELNHRRERIIRKIKHGRITK